jgi:prophage regulatory protein
MRQEIQKINVVELPDEGFVRLSTVLSVFPVGRSTWWAGVKTGRYPRPVKLGPRVTAWKVSDIRELLDRLQPGMSVP